MSNLSFEILINDAFANLCGEENLTPIENKHVLSLMNGFEDKKWREGLFSNFVWDNIAETALSLRERNNLIDQNHTSLVQASKNLRLTDKDKDEAGRGSELAEIFLYGIMKCHYGALSVVPKIFYKQNVQDNAKGMDTVHIVVTPDKQFSLWFGEAKFYNSIEDVRLDKIVKSVHSSLQTNKLKKENSIITSVSDLDEIDLDSEVRDSIKKLLSHTSSIDDLKPKLNVPVLLLHECAITQQTTDLSEEYREKLKEYHRDRALSYFKKQIKKCAGIHKYSDIKFHIILFPVPKKTPLVDCFIKNVEHYKGQPT
ncbi:MAG: DUF1837 domain-containing protein [Alphaproteobacteria bacterium]|nr:DUF1837 domain-containing protein [Alphaproteobacteria bacterium]